MEKVDTFANRLRLALDEKNIKQVDLCKRTGIGKSSLSQYLSGEYEPHGRRLYILAETLDVSIEWLMGFDYPSEREKPMPDLKGTKFEGMTMDQFAAYRLAEFLMYLEKKRPDMSEDKKAQLIAEYMKSDPLELIYATLVDRNSEGK